MLNISEAENPSRSIGVTDEKGSRTEILHISCNLRPGSGLHLNVDVMNAELAAQHLNEVQTAMTEFIREAFARASGMGLPVPTVGGEADA